MIASGVRRGALAMIAAAFAARAEAQERREFTEVHMGVPVRIVVHVMSDSVARAAARAAYARVAELEDKMSDYRADSEVRRLEGRHGAWTPVSPELFVVLARACEMALLSDGAFDPTMGPLVALWRESRRSRRLPARDVLAEARSRAGWRALAVDSARRTARLTRAGMRLDLGGIAKGFILQEALAVLRAHGVGRALVEAGGDLVVGDPPPGRTGWRVAITGVDTLLANVAVATSGGSEQFVEIGGKRYSHVIDPRTGLGVRHHHVVTVLHPDGATADAAATALNVLGPGAGGLFVESSGTVRVYWAGTSPVTRRP